MHAYSTQIASISKLSEPMATNTPPTQRLDLALLGLLRTHPSHGYELHQMLQRTEALGLVWHLKQGNLYALLAKLEEVGYVASTLELHGTKPPRKMLNLTPRGREVFMQWLESPVEHGRDFRQEFLAKLYFAAEEGEHAVDALITRQRAACRAWLVDLERQVHVASPERSFERLVLQFRTSQLGAILSWLDICEATLTPQASSREGPRTHAW
jgi:PadR family transcriptional regulator AphA